MAVNLGRWATSMDFVFMTGLIWTAAFPQPILKLGLRCGSEYNFFIPCVQRKKVKHNNHIKYQFSTSIFKVGSTCLLYPAFDQVVVILYFFVRPFVLVFDLGRVDYIWHSLTTQIRTLKQIRRFVVSKVASLNMPYRML